MSAHGSKQNLLCRGVKTKDKGFDSYESIAMTSREPFKNGDTVHQGSQREENELILLRHSSENNLIGVQAVLEKYPEINVNAKDVSGLGALLLAIRWHNKEMVTSLLNHPRIRLEDSLLHAVIERQKTILEILLNWNTEKQLRGAMELPFESAQFPSHMTPLMLACIHEYTEIADILLQRGHAISLPDPHAYKESEYADDGDALEYGQEKLDAYRAIASPTYISLTSTDPILSAFTLSQETERLAHKDTIYTQEYLKLSQACRIYAAELLGHCRTSEETWMVLKQRCEETDFDSFSVFPRLQLAADMQQTEFISHSNCQKVIYSLWTDQNIKTRNMNFWRSVLYYLPRVLITPFVYVLYFFAPCLPFLKYWESPIIKFMGDAFSYVIFLILLLISILTGQERAGIRVPNLYSPLNVAIWFWISSFICEEFYLFLSKGIHPYVKDNWLRFRFVMTALFMGSFAALGISYLMSLVYGEEYTTLERRFWSSNDPMLVSEALYCMASVMAFFRVLEWFQISKVLGPLQVSLGRMMTNIGELYTVLFLVLLSFASGMNRLYHFYEGSVLIDQNGEAFVQEEAFTSWRKSFGTLFWTIFGQGDKKYADVIVDNTCSNGTSPCNEMNSHDFTEKTGYFMYAVFHIVILLTLLNMLVSLMVNKISIAKDNIEKIWRYNRSLIWLHYINRRTVLPHPFTSLMSVGKIMAFIQWCRAKCGKDPEKVAKWSRSNCCYTENTRDSENELRIKETYKLVVSRLVTRYLNSSGRQAATQPLTAQDAQKVRRQLNARLLEIKAQIAALLGTHVTPQEQVDACGIRGPSASVKSRVSAWSAVTDQELGENII